MLLLVHTALAADFLVYGSADYYESTYLGAMGHDVTVWDDTAWAAATATEFAQFDAIVVGDDSCSGPGSANLQTLYDTRDVWGPVLTGNVMVSGTDPICHYQYGYTGAYDFFVNAVEWSAAAGTTGAYFSGDWGERSLDYLEPLGVFTSTAYSGDDVVIVDSAHAILSGLTEADLDGWGNTYHASITGPSDWDLVLEVDSGADLTLAREGCDADEDGYDSDSDFCAGSDCDDGDADVNPGATELWYDDVDQDCDGASDHDADGDGFDADDDCDDDDAAVNPDADELCDGIDNDCDEDTDEDDATDASTWYIDYDGDGYGSDAYTSTACSEPSGWTSDASDCDDSDDDTWPGADETCDGEDDDCDELVDEDATDAGTWYADTDGDGYGDPASSASGCDAASGYVDNSADCDDGDDAAWSDAEELCDGVDNDCDGDIDGDAVDAHTWYADTDGDGDGDAGVSVESCEEPSGYVDNAQDCDDTSALATSGATEVCDGVDNDCDGGVDLDASDAETWYIDYDGDGYGYGASAYTTESCTEPSGYVDNDGDCDDTSAAASPAGSEVCDGLDNDCNGSVDVGASDATTWYADGDGDGYGDPDASSEGCDPASDEVGDATDCDDGDGGVNPGAEESWYDGVDQDCDGNDDDQDGDGFASDAVEGGDDCDDEDDAVSPDAVESWYDGVDADCAGDSDYDADGDGFDSESFGGEDCNDADPDTWPGAPDDPYDGVVNDCDEADEFDADGDGHDSAASGGDDCDDANSEIHPDAEETWYDGVDQDCDGNDDDQDGDGVSVDEDCDDTDPAVTACDSADTSPGTDSDLLIDSDAQIEHDDTGLSGDAAFKGGSGCGCSGGALGGLWVLGLLAAIRRRRR